MTLQYHAERVADEQCVDTTAIAQLCKTRVVTSQDGNLFVIDTHSGEVDVRQTAGHNVGGHGLTLLG
ncbi:MAG: hypothetical protein CAPSK01_000494 [Candidatus Accumulibacter vicinus]|uniref:Uncharacterized protein n=1 Tax=Candidatus Accumulibacter vicinus TaxID=2954382 RepID=A0A084Y4Y7_9PROT|nr:MAG: hypothetical protein CAPSK01_000494 [Candidatus Accumulibacter vicinus]